MTIFFYYYVVILIGLVAGPWLLLKRRARYGFFNKVGAVPKDLKKKYGSSSDNHRPVWFHAVSVGELNAGLPLIMKLRARYPHQPIIFSSTTGAGHKLAKERLAGVADCFYFPYDVPWAVENYLQSLRPRFVTIIETEIWPGFLTRCKQLNIPATIVNARMSPRSFRNYNNMRWFFKPILRSFSAIGVQSTTEENRFKRVGGDDLNVEVLGNIKFDGLKPLPPYEVQALRQKLNLKDSDKVIVVGSTHEGEEATILSAYKELRSEMKAKLIIAPRHPERFDRVVELVNSAGFKARRFSTNEQFTEDDDVYVLDAIGHLMQFYSVANVAFVGGTLAPIGGHNLLEPYTYSVPVIAGPHIHKTKDVADALESSEAIVFVHDAQELQREFYRLLNNEALNKKLGASGNGILNRSQGAVDRALLMLEKLVDLSAYEEQASRNVESLSGELR